MRKPTKHSKTELDRNDSWLYQETMSLVEKMAELSIVPCVPTFQIMHVCEIEW